MGCRHCEWMRAHQTGGTCVECIAREQERYREQSRQAYRVALRSIYTADPETVTRIGATTFAITRDGITDYVGFCAKHAQTTSEPVVALSLVQPCEDCAAEVTRQRRRERYAALVKAAGMCVLLAMASGARAEGVLIPQTVTAGPLTLGAVAPAAQPMSWGTTKRLIAFAVIGQVLDLVSTDVVLARGGQELNPLMKKRPVRYGVKSLFILSTFGLHALPKGQADSVAKTLGWTGLIPGLANTVQAVAK